MEMRQYLNQAFTIDKRINSKLDQLASLNDLARKATSLNSDMPGCSSRNIHKTEDVIVKIVDLENEINSEIDRLVDLKVEIQRLIHRVDVPDCQMLLEKRYLCFQTWEQIADELGYSMQHIFRLRAKALKEFSKVFSRGE